MAKQSNAIDEKPRELDAMVAKIQMDNIIKKGLKKSDDGTENDSTDSDFY